MPIKQKIKDFKGDEFSRIEELEEKFEKKFVVSFLIGDTESRTLNIEERAYIADYITLLEENIDKILDNIP